MTDQTEISLPRDLIERLCQMVYATRGEQRRLNFIDDHEYAELVRLRHSNRTSIETVLTALGKK